MGRVKKRLVRTIENAYNQQTERQPWMHNKTISYNREDRKQCLMEETI